MQAHNPNPFDFVPFSKDGPKLRSIKDFDGLGELLTGYLEVRLKALTPVHIAGYQTSEGTSGESHMYRQNGVPCIPAATIRGCLRSFIEALTSGWVSQANDVYEKVFGGPPGHPNPKGRHVGYQTFPDAINPSFKPKMIKGPEALLDVASYLFGIVVEKEEGAGTEADAPARKSRVLVEDAFIEEDQLDFDQYHVPDIEGEAFMGGGKPSLSNWWYMEPKEVRKRMLEGGREIAEFIGKGYRGRKFYFHQDPLRCVQFYQPENHTWPYPIGFRKVKLECLKPGESTEAFRIYVERVPRKLMMLLVLCLLPGRNIRHKLGYGKAYGYGSIEFEIQAAHWREERLEKRIPPPLENKLTEVFTWNQAAWDSNKLKEIGVESSLIDDKALKYLACIEGWENADQLLFTYPPFAKGYLFGLDTKYENDLRRQNCEPIRQELERHALHLSGDIQVEQKNDKNGTKWEIRDKAGNLLTARVECGVLNIYQRNGNFATPINFRDFQKAAQKAGIQTNGNTTPVKTDQAKTIVLNLYALKKTIDLNFYQAKSNNWDKVLARRP